MRPKDIVRVKDASKKLDLIHGSLKDLGRGEDIAWLRLNKAALEGELLELPARDQIPTTVNEQLIVELYSK